MSNDTMPVQGQGDINVSGMVDAMLRSLIDRIHARADNAYCDMIAIARKDESLGWEIKVERREFGRAELDAHCSAAEKLGRHRALHEAAKMLEELLPHNKI